jgi:hypothetical protein
MRQQDLEESSTPQGDNTCAGAVATVLPDGKVLLVPEGGPAQIYDPAAQAFAPTAGRLHLSEQPDASLNW